MFAQHSVPASDAPTVLHFYNSTVDMIKEIRTLMYRMLAKRFINTEPALNLIASTNWDIAMLGTSTSPYVDIRSILFLYYFIVACIVAWVVACVVTDIVAILMFFLDSRLRVLLKEYENFRDRMQKEPSYDARFRLYAFRSQFCRLKIVPAEVQNILWYHSIINAMETIVEGYSRAKKVRTHAPLLLGPTQRLAVLARRPRPDAARRKGVYERARKAHDITAHPAL